MDVTLEVCLKELWCKLVVVDQMYDNAGVIPSGLHAVISNHDGQLVVTHTFSIQIIRCRDNAWIQEKKILKIFVEILCKNGEFDKWQCVCTIENVASSIWEL